MRPYGASLPAAFTLRAYAWRIGILMLRLGNSIRLTSRDVERLTHLTLIEPEGVKSIDDLDVYVERCKQYYWGTSPDSRKFHRLIDDTVASICKSG
jgi:hypothetical protein